MAVVNTNIGASLAQAALVKNQGHWTLPWSNSPPAVKSLSQMMPRAGNQYENDIPD